MKRIVIDSNVVVSAVLGRSIPLFDYVVQHCAAIVPARVLEETTKILESRRYAEGHRRVDLGAIFAPTTIAPAEISFEHEAAAKWLLGPGRDKDWPILATAMALAAPIWTKDRDFLGTGIATWSNRTIRYYVDGELPA